MFKEALISSIGTYWKMQEASDWQTRLAMHRASSRDPLVEAAVGLNIAGEPEFTALALSGQCSKIILEHLGAYLIRDRAEDGLLAYVAADPDAMTRLAQAAERPDEWLATAWLRVDRFNAEHPICSRPRGLIPVVPV